MITINVRAPEGNVFVILGYAKNFQEQFIKAGVKDGRPDLAYVLKNALDMKYDEILDRLEKTELFKFTHRNRKVCKTKS